jgi:predicted nucleotidyltransferase
VEKAGLEIKLPFLEEIQDLIVPHYAQEWRKKMQIQGQIK